MRAAEECYWEGVDSPVPVWRIEVSVEDSPDAIYFVDDTRIYQRHNLRFDVSASARVFQRDPLSELVEKKFAGSIPAFLTAFTKSQQLTADEIQEMQQMINRFRKEHPDD